MAATSAVERPPGGHRHRASRRLSAGKRIAPGAIVVLGVLHGWAIWIGLGGRAGLTNGWPLWRDDHPLYFHSALVTRTFLKDSYTTAGYDPSFMAGYAKSVVFPASSTLPELVIAAFGGARPEFAYKVYVLVSAAAAPWLLAIAGWLWGLRPAATAVAVLLALLDIWTDFPLSYAEFGMLPYFLGIPLGLVATGTFARFLVRRRVVAWLMAVGFLSVSVLVHFTTAMVVAPAALLAYLAAVLRPARRSPASPVEDGAGARPEDPQPQGGWTWRGHLAVLAMPVVVLALNAFWWLPGIWLASTKGPSSFAFAHSSESVVQRLLQIVQIGPPIQALLLATGLPGLVLRIRRSPVPGWALCGFCAAGMGWGYLAGAFAALDFLQPGRHTYAMFTGLALAGGVGLEEMARRLSVASRGVDRFDRWVVAGAVLIAVRMVGPPLVGSVQGRLGMGNGEPFLSSQPSPRLKWVVDQVRRHVRPGERLLYEEGGFSLAGLADPFQRGRFSGLLPHLARVEVIGGPYLHAALTTNFTQFGEGKLFGRAGWYRLFSEDLATLKLDLALAETVFGWRDRLWLEQLREHGTAGASAVIARWDGWERFLEKVRQLDPTVAAKIFGQTGWDRAFFLRYARLYRPSAIVCWSPDARWFCRHNPDVIQILADDGTVLLGRVLGFSGDTIAGQARVEAGPGGLRVRDLVPGLDGSLVLRYHSVPCLTTRPPVACEPESLEEDPVPFIRLRPPPGTRDVELKLRFPDRHESRLD